MTKVKVNPQVQLGFFAEVEEETPIDLQEPIEAEVIPPTKAIPVEELQTQTTARTPEVPMSSIESQITTLKGKISEALASSDMASVMSLAQKVKELEAFKGEATELIEWVKGLSDIKTIQQLLGIKKGKRSSASSKTHKGGWTVSDGKAYYNGSEATGLKANKNGAIGVVIKGLKGAPPRLEKASEEAKQILSTFKPE